ncbi:MAG: hypothetical protein OEW60_03900 [Thiovulaceae bacterium]|nr:hypothetical protein [Sulfurimonadaceae bacterium]
MTIKLEQIYAQKETFLDLSAKNTSIERAEALFINSIHSYTQTLKLDHLDLSIESINFGGMLSKKSQVLLIQAKRTKIKKHRAFFLVSHNGYAFIPRMYKLMATPYFEAFREKPAAQRIDFIKAGFDSLQDQQEFSFFDTLLDKLYEHGLSALKPAS